MMHITHIVIFPMVAFVYVYDTHLLYFTIVFLVASANHFRNETQNHESHRTVIGVAPRNIEQTASRV